MENSLILNGNEEGLVMMFLSHTSSQSDDPSESLYVWRGLYEDKE